MQRQRLGKWRKKKKNVAAQKVLQSTRRVTWVRSAEKGAGSQATRVPELYSELDRKRWPSEAITWKATTRPPQSARLVALAASLRVFCSRSCGFAADARVFTCELTRRMVVLEPTSFS